MFSVILFSLKNLLYWKGDYNCSTRALSSTGLLIKCTRSRMPGLILVFQWNIWSNLVKKIVRSHFLWKHTKSMKKGNVYLAESISPCLLNELCGHLYAASLQMNHQEKRTERTVNHVVQVLSKNNWSCYSHWMKITPLVVSVCVIYCVYLGMRKDHGYMYAIPSINACALWKDGVSLSMCHVHCWMNMVYSVIG